MIRRGRVALASRAYRSEGGGFGEDLPCSLVSCEVRCVDPPPDRAVATTHGRHQGFVAVEGELFLRVADGVAVPAGVDARSKGNDQQTSAAQCLTVEVELLTVWDDPVDDGGEAGIGEVRCEPAEVLVAQAHLAGGFVGWFPVAPIRGR